MVGRESDMQESPPRGSPVWPHRQACPVCPHRQAVSSRLEHAVSCWILPQQVGSLSGSSSAMETVDDLIHVPGDNGSAPVLFEIVTVSVRGTEIKGWNFF
jgi:hypothetical protein